MKELLKTHFGFSSFRPHQEAVIQQILTKRDVVAVMPTGGGKSLCYQLPSLMLPGTVVVVSPLISLMKDQVDAARGNNLAAAFLNSSLTPERMAGVYEALSAQRLNILYIAPERLASPGFLHTLDRIDISLFAVDEAHCISEWGPDFRPDYLNLSGLRARYPGVPMAAFTASATMRVQEDIIRLTGLSSPFILRASFDRKNLLYRVAAKFDINTQVLDFLRRRPSQPGIIYRTTRKSVIDMASFLNSHGVSSLPYHAGLETVERTANQEAFNRDRVQVMVATIAFGMGIDKSNVRFVVHADLPKTIEGYYQETGRAGRDGEPAECLLFFGRGDLPRHNYFINLMGDDAERRMARNKLEAMTRYAASSDCRRKTLLDYFGEKYPASACGACDVCTDRDEKTDITEDARLVLLSVLRLNEQFGVTHVVDFTAGANTERIRKYGHQRVPHYGAGRGKPSAHWKRVTEDLITGEYIKQWGDKYPVLKLSASGLEVLAEKRRVLVRAWQGIVSRPAPENQDCNEVLFERLRSLRRAVAAEHGIPPYIVFSDKTLREMAARRPESESGLAEIHGVGEMKLRCYGEIFMREIRKYRSDFPHLALRRKP